LPYHNQQQANILHKSIDAEHKLERAVRTEEGKQLR
jgi:hypothetical protein